MRSTLDIERDIAALTAIVSTEIKSATLLGIIDTGDRYLIKFAARKDRGRDLEATLAELEEVLNARHIVTSDNAGIEVLFELAA